MNKFFCIKYELFIDVNYEYKDIDCVIYDCEKCIYKGVEEDMKISKVKKEIFWKHFLKSLNEFDYKYWELSEFMTKEEESILVNELYNLDLKSILSKKGYVIDEIDRRHFGIYPKKNLKCYLVNGLKVMICKDASSADKGIKFQLGISYQFKKEN